MNGVKAVEVLSGMRLTVSDIRGVVALLVQHNDVSTTRIGLSPIEARDLGAALLQAARTAEKHGA